MIDRKLDRYPILIFLTYRFMYGFRTIAPLVIGAGKTKTSRFLILSAMSTLVWGITYSAIGYLFGEVVKSKLGHIENIEKYVIGILLLLGGVIFILHVRKTPSLKGGDISTNLLILDIFFDCFQRSSSTGSNKITWRP